MATKTLRIQGLFLHLGQRLREGGLLLAAAVSLYLIISLFTYSPGDPGWSNSGGGHHLRNSGGLVGAWFADCFLYLFGYLAYVFPLLLACSAWWLFRSGSKGKEYCGQTILLRSIGFILSLLAGCGLASLYITNNSRHLPYTAGGIFGNLVGPTLTSQFNQLGITILLVAILLGGITWFSGLSWLRFSYYLGACGHYCLKMLKHAVSPVTGKIKRKLAKPLLSLPKPEQVSAPHTPSITTQAKVVPEIVDIETATPIMSKPPKSLRIKSKPRQDGLLSLELLKPNLLTNSNNYTPEFLQARSRLVEEKLADFGVEAYVKEVHPGPVVTRYELALAPGVKVSKIAGLARDIARSLSIISVRVVEVIPGKALIGLELPNDSREMVRLREVLESQEYAHAKSPLSLALGKDIAGRPIIVDLAKMPHLLVAGTTGSGKSVGVNAMLLSLLYKAKPEEVRLILVDPKMLELSVYDDIPHLLTPVVTDMKEAANSLRWCVAEMERRYRLMAALGVRNIAGYNKKIAEAQAKGKPLTNPFQLTQEGVEPEVLEHSPYIVVCIYEFADMMMVVGKKVEQLIARIAQKARAAGIHLILATQRPSVDVITGLIKANIPTRISFQVSSKVDSRTILDQMGAEQLLGQGDMLYLPPGTAVPVRVHGAFVDDDEVHNVVEQLKEMGEPAYLEEITNGGNELSATEAAYLDEGGASGEDVDEFYDLAVHFVTKTRKASISSVQRRFKIGYNRAARIIEQMEQAGVVSPMEGSGNREVLAPAPIED